MTTICHYCIIANYSWVFIEGLYLHNLIFLALFSDTSAISLYVTLGWGTYCYILSRTVTYCLLSRTVTYCYCCHVLLLLSRTVTIVTYCYLLSRTVTYCLLSRTVTYCYCCHVLLLLSRTVTYCNVLSRIVYCHVLSRTVTIVTYCY